jgi:hypothetical protein
MKFSDEDDDLVFWAAYKKAGGRVGNTVSSTMRKWFLKVIRADLNHLSDDCMNKLRWEVAVFTNKTATKERLPDFAVEPIYAWRHIGGMGPLSIPSEETVKLLLQDARRCVEELVDKGKTEYKFSSLETLTVARTKVGFMQGKVYLRSPEANFQYALMLLLARYGHRIGRCPCCLNLFYRSRIDKATCGGSCRSTLNGRKRRDTPPERFNKRGRPKSASRFHSVS